MNYSMKSSTSSLRVHEVWGTFLRIFRDLSNRNKDECVITKTMKGASLGPSRSTPPEEWLQYLQDGTLQAPGLRHAGEDGMVGALASLFDEADVSEISVSYAVQWGWSALRSLV
jgi:hypothetical protein